MTTTASGMTTRRKDGTDPKNDDTDGDGLKGWGEGTTVLILWILTPTRTA